jgi:hypothetical protein
MNLRAEGTPEFSADQNIAGQIDSALIAYEAVAAQLTKRRFLNGVKLPLPELLRSMIADKQAQWQGDGTYDFVNRANEKSGVMHTLFVTPNVPADANKIKDLAETLRGTIYSRRQDNGPETAQSTFMDDILYANYSAQVLSGNIGSEPVRIGLLSDIMVGYSGDGFSIDDQDAVIPPYHVPSVLEAVSVWYMRNQQQLFGMEGVGPRRYKSRYGDLESIHHVNLPPRPNRYGVLSLPWTYVNPVFDEIRLIGSDANNTQWPSRYVMGS